jgi:hypothetical protein
MTKDKRYKPLKTVIESGTVKGFEDLLTVVPFSVIRKDLGLSYQGMTNRMENGQKFLLQDLIRLAELIECDPLLLIKIVLLDISEQNRKTKRKS